MMQQTGPSSVGTPSPYDDLALVRVFRMAVRQARLRPEWAHFYPELEAGVWMVAAQLVPLVLRHRLQDQRTWEFTQRILVDSHFEFRGGRTRDASWSGVLTRVEDA
jgi:hypothetical protein